MLSRSHSLNVLTRRQHSGQMPGRLRATLSVKGGKPGGRLKDSKVLGSLRQEAATK